MKNYIFIILLFFSCNFNRVNNIELSDKYLADTINRISIQYNIDPVFTAAIIKAESNFDRTAKSHSKAIGYMQLKKGAAYDGLNYSGYSNLAKTAFNNTGYLYHSDINILSGVSYLRWIMDKKKPIDWIELMAYYNSGQSDKIVGSYVIKIKRYYEKHSKINIDKSFKGMK